MCRVKLNYVKTQRVLFRRPDNTQKRISFEKKFAFSVGQVLERNLHWLHFLLESWVEKMFWFCLRSSLRYIYYTYKTFIFPVICLQSLLQWTQQPNVRKFAAVLFRCRIISEKLLQQLENTTLYHHCSDLIILFFILPRNVSTMASFQWKVQQYHRLLSNYNFTHISTASWGHDQWPSAYGAKN